MRNSVAQLETFDNEMITITVCVCTYKRPKMLSRCFFSLIRQHFSADWNVIFIIIDNEPAQENHELIKGLKDSTSYPVHYMHQPKRGRATARNTALEMSLKLNADWICFFDDDQFVDKNAIKTAFSAAQQYQADVVKMHVHYVLEKATEHYVITRPSPAEGQILQSCGTGGVLFHRNIVSSLGLGLTFDENMGLSSHEDTVFFSKVSAAGRKIVSTKSSIVYETTHPERLSVRHHCFTAFYYAKDSFHYFTQQKQYRKIFEHISTLPLKLLAPLELILLPFYYVLFDVAYVKFRFIKIVKRLFWAAGILSVILKLNSEKYTYETITGE